eukprot:jgi/Tetstr1/434324/TSEL_023430.t1
MRLHHGWCLNLLSIFARPILRVQRPKTASGTDEAKECDEGGSAAPLIGGCLGLLSQAAGNSSWYWPV